MAPGYRKLRANRYFATPSMATSSDFSITLVSISTIRPSDKSQNASVPNPTMQNFVTEMCTCVHISVAKWCIVGYLSHALWDMWDGSIHSLHMGAMASQIASTLTFCSRARLRKHRRKTNKALHYWLLLTWKKLPLCDVIIWWATSRQNGGEIFVKWLAGVTSETKWPNDIEGQGPWHCIQHRSCNGGIPTRVNNSYDQPQLPPTKMAPAENGESKQSRILSTSSNTNWHNHVLIQPSR